MNQQIFFRICGIFTILSGMIDFLAAAAAIGGVFVSVKLDQAVTGILMVNVLFISLALIGSYAVQYPEAGALGLTGISLSLLALLITFMLPLPGYGLYLLGLLMFAAASARARVLPTTAVWLWLMGSFIAVAGGFLEFTLLYTLGFLIAGGSRIWLGYSLWSNPTIKLSAQPVV